MPVLDARDAPTFFAELEQRLAAFTPELAKAPSGNVSALLQVLAQYLGITVQRLNQAPRKNFLAFLEMLAINALPPQPARAPLVFTPLPSGVNGTIPAGTRAGANVAGAAQPLVFETESTVAMCAAKLVAAVSLWPDRDAWLDHSTDLAGARPFVLFENLQPVQHVVYLAHDNLLAFMGRAIVEVSVNFAPGGSSALAVTWQHWDGQVWRPFAGFDASDPAASQDGTAGLTRNGIITLRAVCGSSLPSSVSNLNSHWIRGVLAQALPPDPARVLAAVDQIKLRATVDRSLIGGSGGTFTGVVPIDQAFADTQSLDLSKTFYPFGKSPNTDSAFYLVCSEAFAKAGARVTIFVEHTNTPEQDADALTGPYGIDVNNARNALVGAEESVANTLTESAWAAVDLTAGGQSAVPSGVSDALSAYTQAVLQFSNNPKDLTPVINALNDLQTSLQGLTVGVTYQLYPNEVDVAATNASMGLSKGNSLAALADGNLALSFLKQLNAPAALAGGGTPPPSLPPPQLVWEYWNGTQWNTLVGPGGDDTVNLLKTGTFQFTVPQDLAPYALNGQPSLAVRARLFSGSYNQLQIVTWTDPTTGTVNYYALVLPRPPALKNLALGYVWRSRWEAPEQCFTLNDFVFEDHTADAASPRSAFPPYHPVVDTLPALYLGFDQPLPNDLVSLYLNIVESGADGPPLVWEAWDGTAWRALKATDDTGALARPGMVSFLAPAVAPRASASVASASAMTITTDGPLQAAQFVPGNRVVITSGKTSEMGTIASIAGAALLLQTPLAQTYNNATVQLAALPRFGSPLDWVRARLRQDGTPEAARVLGIYLNAAWAQQRQTITNETLGSGLGQSSQTFFFSHFPVLPGERIEVRELAGAQANVQFPILRQQLLAQGFTNDDIRTVADPRTGELTQVWVRWREQETLYFSGPDDRDYTIERTRGRVIVGDGTNGMLLPPGNSNVRATLYQAGGGSIGDVPAGAITQMMSGVAATSVTNPVAAEAGADGEALAGVEWRGPQVLRHRYRAISTADYEALAREASSGVAVARALAATAENLRPAPGCVTVIIIPQSNDPQPQPSYELRQQVAGYLAARAPASIAPGNIAVIGPTYLAVGVIAIIAPLVLDQAGVVKAAAVAALLQFFNPLTGGRDGGGWPFGRDVYISDVALLLESIPGVDYVTNLELLIDQIPQGDLVSVPAERVVAAGDMLISMEGAPTL
jgi:hypothetical protein